MLRALPYILGALVYLWAIVEAAGTPSPRLMQRWSWVLLTLVPGLGTALWFIAGRPYGNRPGGNRPGRKRPKGPDDDPDFLRSL